MAAVVLLAAACSGPEGEAAMSGYAEAELVYVAPSSAGTLVSLAVKRGDSVKKGQPLYALDTDAELLGKQAAQARSERALAQEQNLRKGRRPAEVQAIDQQLAQAQAALAAATSALRRNQQLVNHGFQSTSRLEELVAARDGDAASDAAPVPRHVSARLPTGAPVPSRTPPRASSPAVAVPSHR